MCLDFDDTLLDNATSSRLGLRALVGDDAAWPVWRRTTEQHYARFVAGEIDFERMCQARIRAFFAAFGEDISDGEAAERERYRMAAMQREWRLFDDAVPCLEWLRASGLRLALITNAPGAYQRKKIAAVGVGEYFDAFVISAELGVAKPDGRIFDSACSTLGLRPDEVVHVGDRLDVDALGAARAGMRGVWLNRSGSKEVPPAGVAMITNLHELPELLVYDLATAPEGGPTGAPPRQRAAHLGIH